MLGYLSPATIKNDSTEARNMKLVGISYWSASQNRKQLLYTDHRGSTVIRMPAPCVVNWGLFIDWVESVQRSTLKAQRQVGLVPASCDGVDCQMTRIPATSHSFVTVIGYDVIWNPATSGHRHYIAYYIINESATLSLTDRICWNINSRNNFVV